MPDFLYGDFEWDSAKARRNRRDHGVSFTEGASVFDDPLFVTYYSSRHSGHEDRYVIIGQSSRHRLLAVAYTERERRTRIVSARTVTPAERRSYEQAEEEF
jgi:uncharacterized DUF497 family protein